MLNFQQHFGGVLLGIALLMAASPAFAHFTLKSSSIKDGAVLSESPSEIILTFSKEVGLTDIDLTDSVGDSVDLDYSPPTDMDTSFEIPLPDLQADSYTLSWRAMAPDGHVMSGDLTFSIVGK
jgi:methionine-rich copper-binding protein CopC